MSVPDPRNRESIESVLDGLRKVIDGLEGNGTPAMQIEKSDDFFDLGWTDAHGGKLLVYRNFGEPEYWLVIEGQPHADATIEFSLPDLRRFLTEALAALPEEDVDVPV